MIYTSDIALQSSKQPKIAAQIAGKIAGVNGPKPILKLMTWIDHWLVAWRVHALYLLFQIKFNSTDLELKWSSIYKFKQKVGEERLHNINLILSTVLYKLNTEYIYIIESTIKHLSSNYVYSRELKVRVNVVWLFQIFIYTLFIY